MNNDRTTKSSIWRPDTLPLASLRSRVPLTRPIGKVPAVPFVVQISSVGSGALRTSIQSRMRPGAESLSRICVSGPPSLDGGHVRPTKSIQPKPLRRASASIVPTPRTASRGSLSRTGTDGAAAGVRGWSVGAGVAGLGPDDGGPGGGTISPGGVGAGCPGGVTCPVGPAVPGGGNARGRLDSGWEAGGPPMAIGPGPGAGVCGGYDAGCVGARA